MFDKTRILEYDLDSKICDLVIKGKVQIEMEGMGTVCILVDNGSIRRDAVLFTRKIAEGLASKLSCSVIAASLAHSDQIPPINLHGRSVPLLEELLKKFGESSEIQKVVILPFMLVTGGAIFQKVEACVGAFANEYAETNFVLRDALISGDCLRDVRIIGMLVDSINAVIDTHALKLSHVVLVDHGSPYVRSIEVRNYVAKEIEKELKNRVQAVIPSSMERRSGEAYDFNEPLLKQALIGLTDSTVILARLFLQPGRHNGKKGDVDEICRNVILEDPGLRIFETERVFKQKKLILLLEDRYKEFDAREGVL